MKISPYLQFYGDIMAAETEGSIADLTIQIQTAVLGKILTDNKEITILNMALQIKSNYFLIKELSRTHSGTTYYIIGGDAAADFDMEQEQLDEFAEEELEEFENGNVVPMKSFKKKDK